MKGGTHHEAANDITRSVRLSVFIVLIVDHGLSSTTIPIGVVGLTESDSSVIH